MKEKQKVKKEIEKPLEDQLTSSSFFSVHERKNQQIKLNQPCHLKS